MSLRWGPWRGPDGRTGLSATLPYELTDQVHVEAVLRLYVDDVTNDGATGGVLLEIRVDAGDLWTCELSTHKSVDEALQRLDTTWRSAVMRAGVARAAWDACP